LLALPSAQSRTTLHVFSPWAGSIPARGITIDSTVTAAHQECELVTRSLGRIAGLRVNYACAGSGLLLGLPTRGRTWTSPYAPTVTARTYRRVALRSVWW